MDFISSVDVFAIIGFLLGAYSIVANDAIQTLGTFLSSNSHRPWWVLWIFASLIIVAVLSYGFIVNGDIAFGRLNSIPFPQAGIQWWHAIPALALLILTRYGIPVSTTFLVLTIFTLSGGAATEGVMEKMLLKSALGYVVALVAGGLLYLAVARQFETWISATRDRQHDLKWTVIQWGSTAFLWSQWLIQDLANIFVFLPRTTSCVLGGETVTNITGLNACRAAGIDIEVSFAPALVVFAVIVMLVLHAIIFATRGGEIQKIVLSKTNTTDVRAATVVDFMYGMILLVFKELSDIPMSTTWVFLGLLAGREMAISYVTALRGRKEAFFDVWTDAARAFAGLIISVILAIALPATASGHWWAYALLTLLALAFIALAYFKKPSMQNVPH